MRDALTRLAVGVLLVVALAGCNLSTEIPPTPTPPVVLPEVQFLFPANDATVVEGSELDIEILATDAGIGVGRVELLVDDQFLNETMPEVSAAVPLFTTRMNWLAQGVGRHTLTATAYRPDGTQSDPVTILINVLPADGDLSALDEPEATAAP